MSGVSSVSHLDGSELGGGFALSLVCGFGALAGSAALVGSAGSFRQALELVLVFAVLTSLECVAYVGAVRPLLQRRRVPARGQAFQVLVVVLVLLAFTGGPAMGLIGLCALATGVFLPNASTIRTNRVDRSFTDPGGQGVTHGLEGLPQTTDRPPRARPVAEVGLALRASVVTGGERWLAWAAATLAVTVLSLAFRAPGEVVLAVDFVGVAALAWATQRLLAARLAQRDFEQALAEPRLAYVVLVRDSWARGMRPLLGVWDKEPLHIGGRLPRAHAVYRCERECVALLSTKGALVVHRAWVDTGPHPVPRPRWVAADAGIALPRRRAALGSWHLDSVIGAERPSRSRPLTRPAPDPTTEAENGTFVTVINEPTRDMRRFVRLFVRRLLALSLAGLLLAWVRSGG